MEGEPRRKPQIRAPQRVAGYSEAWSRTPPGPALSPGSPRHTENARAGGGGGVLGERAPAEGGTQGAGLRRPPSTLQQGRPQAQARP